MGTVTGLPPRPQSREPSCHHDDHQPASLCRVCSVDGRLAEWRRAWRRYDEACAATCDMRPMPDRPPFKAPSEKIRLHNQAQSLDIWYEVAAERARAHGKHGESSMEAQPPESYIRLAILVEEVGELARVFNEARHGDGDCDLAALRAELIQVAAMAGAWADVI